MVQHESVQNETFINFTKRKATNFLGQNYSIITRMMTIHAKRVELGK